MTKPEKRYRQAAKRTLFICQGIYCQRPFECRIGNEFFYCDEGCRLKETDPCLWLKFLEAQGKGKRPKFRVDRTRFCLAHHKPGSLEEEAQDGPEK